MIIGHFGEAEPRLAKTGDEGRWKYSMEKEQRSRDRRKRWLAALLHVKVVYGWKY
ncbi:MAG TPA: hypothetical protein PLI05_04780 [Methanotrichaceae archaeon]|nr:hypothetical protein [Methanotrichaceae archaeon]